EAVLRQLLGFGPVVSQVIRDRVDLLAVPLDQLRPRPVVTPLAAGHELGVGVGGRRHRDPRDFWNEKTARAVRKRLQNITFARYEAVPAEPPLEAANAR